VQGHQEKRQSHGDLRESEAQTEAGLTESVYKGWTSLCIITQLIASSRLYYGLPLLVQQDT
jgi:hypothetical protein